MIYLYKAAQKLKPKSTSFSAMKAELESIAAQKAEAERNLKYWQDVQSTYQEARNIAISAQEQTVNRSQSIRLSENEVKYILSQMEANASEAPILELSEETWQSEFPMQYMLLVCNILIISW